MHSHFNFFKFCDVQIEAYRDMITPVVDAFKYLTQVFMCFRVFTFLPCLLHPLLISIIS